MPARNKDGSKRDTQCSRLYAAEKLIETIGERVDDMEVLTAFVNKVIASAPIQRRYGKVLNGWPVKIGDGRKQRNALGDFEGIDMPRWSRSRAVVLHELAHTIKERLYGVQAAGHGPEYASVLLTLVRFGMGVEAHQRLKIGFATHKVRFAPARGQKFVERPMWLGQRQRATAKAVRKDQGQDSRRVPDYDLGSKREFAALKRKHGFKGGVDRLGYITFEPSPIFPLGFTTLHHSWMESVRRLTMCMADPTLLDDEGGYSE